jgi:DNA-binding MarR family transcriptional regulator
MAVLGDSGALTQRDLTRLTLMDKVAVNRACKVLEERGLAWRRPNTQDGRSHLLELTGRGRAHARRDHAARARDGAPPVLELRAPRKWTSSAACSSGVRGEVKDLDADDIDSGNFGVE